jgi:hypothetical protein
MPSPLRSRPLRTAGESLTYRRTVSWLKHVQAPALMAGFLIVIAVLEWYRWATGIPPAPMLYTGAALAATVFAAFRIWAAHLRLQNMVQGEEGEKETASILDKLRLHAANIFHDVPGQGFNVDHVVIHKTGIYAVETKTPSKPNGKTQIFYDGSRLYMAEDPKQSTSGVDGIDQAKANAKWLSKLLQETTGKRFPVRPVLAFPGWWVNRSGAGLNGDLLVINPKQMEYELSRSPERLRSEDVHLCAYHLDRHIRTAKDPS